MRNYELMVILDPSIDARTVAPQMEKYLEQVTANGGSVEKVDIWGKRRLASAIRTGNNHHLAIVHRKIHAF